MLHTITIWILPLIIVLGAAVTLHEFGHFIVAKILKIRVETFSFGFGPRLLGKKWGTTDYRISAIPLGGYVKLGGDESNAPIEGEGEADIPACERFDLRPRWQRIAVAVAGHRFTEYRQRLLRSLPQCCKRARPKKQACAPATELFPLMGPRIRTGTL